MPSDTRTWPSFCVVDRADDEDRPAVIEDREGEQRGDVGRAARRGLGRDRRRNHQDGEHSRKHSMPILPERRS